MRLDTFRIYGYSTAMNRYELLTENGPTRIRALGSTRAGVFIAAIKGLCAAEKPRFVENSERVERLFNVEAADAVNLLAAVLNEARRLSRESLQAYEDVAFTLITDKKAEGKFVDRAVTGFDAEISAITPENIEMGQNGDGMRQAMITLA
jgi:SHS2 domain-containing protein